MKTKYPFAGIAVLFKVAAVPVVVFVTADGDVVTFVNEVTSVPYPILYVTDGEEPFTTAMTFEIVLASVVKANVMFSLDEGLSTVIDRDQTCPLYPL